MSEALVGSPHVYARGTDLAEGVRPTPEIVIAGWACTMRRDVERGGQIFGFVLPGDVLGSFWRLPEFTFWRVTALTSVEALPAAALLATDDEDTPVHAETLKAARRAEDYGRHLLVDQLIRLGGRDAYTGRTHLLLELHGRLEQVGLA